jgi:hypothetical protein
MVAALVISLLLNELVFIFVMMEVVGVGAET